jgi:hypothetical protein
MRSPSSVCVCVCVRALGDGSVNMFLRLRIVGRVVFYAVRVVLKGSRRLVLPRFFFNKTVLSKILHSTILRRAPYREMAISPVCSLTANLMSISHIFKQVFFIATLSTLISSIKLDTFTWYLTSVTLSASKQYHIASEHRPCVPWAIREYRE